MGVLVGLGLGVGLLLAWSAFFLPRRAVRPRRTPPRLATLLGSAGLGHVSPLAFTVLCVVCGAGATLLMQVVTRTPPVAVLFGVMAGLVPVTVVSSRARRRHREFAEVWPEAVDNLASAVRAGMSLPDALAALAVRGPEPLRESFDAFALDHQLVVGTAAHDPPPQGLDRRVVQRAAEGEVKAAAAPASVSIASSSSAASIARPPARP